MGIAAKTAQACCCSSTAVGATLAPVPVAHHGELPPTVLGAELPRARRPITSANCMPGFATIVVIDSCRGVLRHFGLAGGVGPSNHLTAHHISLFCQFDIPRQRRHHEHFFSVAEAEGLAGLLLAMDMQHDFQIGFQSAKGMLPMSHGLG